MTELACIVLALPFVAILILGCCRMDKDRNDRKKRLASEEWESDES